MADDSHGSYLAARILTESQPVTYRLLSRALKVNVNTAKLMLFDFHQSQNAKQSKSVHATYLLTGNRRSPTQPKGLDRDGEDLVMRSSPFMSSMMDPEEVSEAPVPKMTIVLAREEEVERVRATFEDEVTIHIYSLEPGPLENLHALCACNLEVAMTYASEDPMERWRTYGDIQNPYIKRRTAKYAPSGVNHKLDAGANATAKSNMNLKGSKEPLQNPGDNVSGRSASSPSVSATMLKRSDSKPGNKNDNTAGSIFKSFAKAKSKAREVEQPQASALKPSGDKVMQGMSEDEGEEDDKPEIVIDDLKNEAARKAREERTERLHEEMLDAPTLTESQPAPSPPTTAKLASPEPSESESKVTVHNGRRRGRRRVMKRQKVKDEEGYLVTREEAVWESFSEDEPEPKKLKSTPIPKVAGPGKGKTNGKKGQGSIASFFKKA
ncbi:hypothetical protein IQ07DRAFT_684177 [Pyrenochaeta sp. DS3sAY3a]|nr:hypothetical protein IQ07DRAFT_684177 [Pyrenochaeta sp. DS3sAY3a]